MFASVSEYGHSFLQLPIRKHDMASSFNVLQNEDFFVNVCTCTTKLIYIINANTYCIFNFIQHLPPNFKIKYQFKTIIAHVG